MSAKTKLLLLFGIPAIIPVLGLILYYFLGTHAIPSLAIFILIELFITLPIFFWMMCQFEHQSFSFSSIKKIIGPQNCVSGLHFTLICIGTLIWAMSIFMLSNGLSLSLQNNLFSWLPEWANLGDYLLNKANYSTLSLKTSWILLAVASLLFPIAEELYFRGYVLPKTNHLGKWSPVVHTLFFALYHLWSIWLFPIRFIATLPLYYFVWKHKNIYLGIVVHCILNIVGDVIFSYGEIF